MKNQEAASAPDQVRVDLGRGEPTAPISFPLLTHCWASPSTLSCSICPAEGKGAALVLPRCNTEGMTLHLAEISAAVAPGAHAVLILDQAGRHISAGLVIPANITLRLLQAKCPELNPVENVWQFMRDNWLSNRIFKSYDDILDHCCFAWNRLTDQPWRIMSIGLRQWAHG